MNVASSGKITLVDDSLISNEANHYFFHKKLENDFKVNGALQEIHARCPDFDIHGIPQPAIPQRESFFYEALKEADLLITAANHKKA